MTTELTSSKRAMLSMSRAMEDVLASVAGPDCLVVALFQRRGYFEVEARRYESLAELGTTVIVAFAGSIDGIPQGVSGVSLDSEDPLGHRWDVIVLAPGLGMALLTEDQYALAAGEQSLEAARMFNGSWTFQPQAAAAVAADRLDVLGPKLPPDVLARASRIVAMTEAEPYAAALDHAATITEQLVLRIDQAHQRSRSAASALGEARRAAETDALTGLHNRHHLDRYLGTAPSDSSAQLIALLVDLDDLRAINEAGGHGAGDAALVAVADAIRSHTRDGDVVCRFGGDEFLVLMPGIDAEQGLQVGQRIAQAVRGTPMPTPWEGLGISVSVGVSPAEPAHLPIQALDEALYEVKRGGKGYAVLATGAVVERHSR